MTNLGHNDEFFSGKPQLPDSVAEDDLGQPVRVHLGVKFNDELFQPCKGTHICSVEGGDAVIIAAVGGVQPGANMYSGASTDAYLMCLIASSSGSTQFIQSLDPYDMHPRMIFDTFSPELPRRTTQERHQQDLQYHAQNALTPTVGHFRGHSCSLQKVDGDTSDVAKQKYSSRVVRAS